MHDIVTVRFFSRLLIIRSISADWNENETSRILEGKVSLLNYQFISRKIPKTKVTLHSNLIISKKGEKIYLFNKKKRMKNIISSPFFARMSKRRRKESRHER